MRCGPEAARVHDDMMETTPLPLLGRPLVAEGTGGAEEPVSSIMTVEESAIVAHRNPAGTFSLTHSDQIVIYTVQPGDVPGKIASQFGISLNTLLWANNLRNAHLIKAGDELIILPVSGVKYEVKKGDTVEVIARKFKPKSEDTDILGFMADIQSFNGLVINETLEAGTTIIIPDGEMELPPPPARVAPQTQVARAVAPSLPNHSGYYIRPIAGGRKTRGIHGYNGVDLANSCGLPVRASASGTVIIARSTGWNGGYGQYVVITHPNGTQTLYAHLSAIFVGVGEWVVQGTTIGNIGTTGNSTGCHVHFEIRGARNTF